MRVRQSAASCDVIHLWKISVVEAAHNSAGPAETFGKKGAPCLVADDPSTTWPQHGVSTGVLTPAAYNMAQS